MQKKLGTSFPGKPHPLQREEGSGHTVTLSCRRGTQLSNTVISNKMLRSVKHVDIIVLHDNGYDLWRAQIWLATWSFCCGDNSMVAAWPDPFSLRRVWLARLQLEMVMWMYGYESLTTPWQAIVLVERRPIHLLNRIAIIQTWWRCRKVGRAWYIISQYHNEELLSTVVYKLPYGEIWGHSL